MDTTVHVKFACYKSIAPQHIGLASSYVFVALFECCLTLIGG